MFNDKVNVAIKAFNSNKRAAYHYMRACESKPVDKKVALFESYHGASISCSPYHLMIELLEHYDFKVYVTTDIENYKKNRDFIKNNHINAEVVLLMSRKYAELLATAGLLVNNTSFPNFYIRREEQIYLNTWHGTPLKTLGKNMKKGINSMYNIQHNFLQSSHLLYPNVYTKKCMMEDYNLEKTFTGKVVIGGYPRNAIFCDEADGKRVKEKLGLTDKYVYIYMPTWRGTTSNSKAKSHNVKQVLTEMDKALDDNSVLYVSLHPTIRDKFSFDGYEHVKEFPKDIPQYQFINCSDCLITDYSSIMFDYSITKKPILLLIDDYQEYIEDRGVYFDIRELPFNIIETLDELCEMMKKREGYIDYSDDTNYYEQFLSYESIDNSGKLLDYLFTGKEEGIKVLDYSSNKEKKHYIRFQSDPIFEKELYDKFVYEGLTDDSILCIDKKYFTSIVNDWFFSEYNQKVQYIIFSPAINFTFHDARSLKKARKHQTDQTELRNKFYEREMRRILPGIENYEMY